LTEVSDGEQFVLPGTSGAPVTRDTLLPEFSSVKFLRNGQLSWLESATAPEVIWPRLLAFIRSEGMAVARTEPAAGLITTQWQPVSGDRSLFKNLISGDAHQRLAFRLERLNSGSRLFVRSQQAGKDVATTEGADTLIWPAESHDAEQTSLVLQRLLVFLGLDEQRASGLLSQAGADAVINEATLELSAGGSRLLLQQGYRPALESVSATLTKLGFTRQPDGTPGVINVLDTASLISAESMTYAVRVEAIHVAAVKISVLDANGDPVDAAAARKLLRAMKDELA